MGSLREFGMVMHTLLYLKWIGNKDLLYSTWDSAQCCIAAWMGMGSGREGTRVCVAESLRCPPETITLFIGSVPIPNKKLKKKKRLGLRCFILEKKFSFFRVLGKHIS